MIKFKKEDVLMVYYFYLHYVVGKPAFNGDGIMSVTETNWRMCEWRVPKPLKPAIIKVWEELGLVKRLDKRNLEFIKTDFDISDLRLVNKELGIDCI